MGAGVSQSPQVRSTAPTTATDQLAQALVNSVNTAVVVAAWRARRPGTSHEWMEGKLLGFETAKEARQAAQGFIDNFKNSWGVLQQRLVREPYKHQFEGRTLYVPRVQGSFSDKTLHFLGCYNEANRDLIQVPAAPGLTWSKPQLPLQPPKAPAAFGKGIS